VLWLAMMMLSSGILVGHSQNIGDSLACSIFSQQLKRLKVTQVLLGIVEKRAGHYDVLQAFILYGLRRYQV